MPALAAEAEPAVEGLAGPPEVSSGHRRTVRPVDVAGGMYTCSAHPCVSVASYSAGGATCATAMPCSPPLSTNDGFRSMAAKSIFSGTPLRS